MIWSDSVAGWAVELEGEAPGPSAFPPAQTCGALCPHSGNRQAREGSHADRKPGAEMEGEAGVAVAGVEAVEAAEAAEAAAAAVAAAESG